jgi:hypothetical protein
MRHCLSSKRLELIAQRRSVTSKKAEILSDTAVKVKLLL